MSMPSAKKPPARLERAINLATLGWSARRDRGNWSRLAARFDWVYLGAEFCENSWPEDARLLAAARFFCDAGVRVCFLSPLLTEKGLQRLARFLDAFQAMRTRHGYPDDLFELTANDFGAVELVRSRGLRLKLNLGRLLKDNVFSSRHAALHYQDRPILDFYASCGITRFEVSIQSARSGPVPSWARISVYHPYANVTSTRMCFVGMRDIPESEDLADLVCGRECAAAAFEMKHPRIAQKLFVRGNTVFTKGPAPFDRRSRPLLAMGADRLVYCPFPS